MLPISAFDEDDREDSLPSLNLIPDQNTRQMNREEDRGPEPEGGLGNGLGRLNPLSRIHNEYNDIYHSSLGASGVLNLKELDAYVKETVRAQRQQRRRELFTKVAIVVSFVIIITAMFGSSIFVFEDVRGSHPFGKRSYNKEKHIFEYELPPGYVQSQCEVEYTHNKSFLALIDETELMDLMPACRKEVSYLLSIGPENSAECVHLINSLTLLASRSPTVTGKIQPFQPLDMMLTLLSLPSGMLPFASICTIFKQSWTTRKTSTSS
jgi:hypothetical protein